MNFEKQYLNYSDYKILGGNLEKQPFDLYQQRAEQILDRETQYRLKNVEIIPNEVKVCLFQLIEGMAFDKLYRDVSANDKQRYIDEIIYNTLAGVVCDGVHLLYRGV